MEEAGPVSIKRHPILGVNVALPAHLARNDPTKNGWHKLWFYETAV